MKLKLCAALGFALLLAGCKTGLNFSTNLSQIKAELPTKVEAVFYTEIPSCEDYQTKLESQSLLDAKQKVPFVFPGAEFLTCKVGKTTYKSFAVFIVNADVGGSIDKCGQDSVCLAYQDNLILFAVGSGIRQRVNQIKKGLLGFDLSEMQMRVTLGNDSGQTISGGFVSGYFEQNKKLEPKHGDYFEIKQGETLTMIPSNAAIEKAFDGKSVILTSIK